MDSRWTSPRREREVGKRPAGGDDGGRFTVWVLTSNWNLDRETAPDLSANCVVMVECKTFHFDIRWSEVCERRELACGHADLHGPDPTWSGTIRGPIHCARKPAARSRQRTWRQGRQSFQEREHSNVNIRVPALAGLAQHGRSQTIGFQRWKSIATHRRIAARVGTGIEDGDAIPAFEVQG